MVTTKSSGRNLSGALETIAAGLSLVMARPYLVILPIVVDLITWLGLQVSAVSLIDPLRRLMIENGGANGPAAARELQGLGERIRVNDTLAALTPSIFGGLPKDSFLNVLLAIIAPPLTRGVDRRDMYGSWGDGISDVQSPVDWFTVLGAAAGFFALATLLIVLYRVPIARSVRGTDHGAGFVRECVDAWARLVALGLLFLTAGILVIGPLLIGAGVLVLLGIDLTAVLAFALFLLFGMAALYTFFTLDAVFVARLGPIASLRLSVAVVKRNLGPTARFALATVILATGALQIWSAIVQNIPGIFIALTGNAVLGTGLSIASMMFFHDRFKALPADNSGRIVPATARR
jgi:hypothetical protein